jgi:gamma-tubulin complex component 2
MPQSPQPLGGPPSHKRMPSGSQRSGRNVEERRTERVQLTTRETLTSRTRSPDRRPGPSVVAAERSKPVGSIKTNNKDTGPKISRGEPAQGMLPNPLLS